jgi:hypothetical protein
VAQTGEEEKKKAAEEALRRFHFGAKAVNIGGVRLKLAQDRGKIKAEKYGNPQLIAEIKTALENRIREILNYEFERWKNHIKVKGGRKMPNNNIPTAPKTRARPQHSQNTQRKNLKTHTTTKTHPPQIAAPRLLTRRSRVQEKPAHESRRRRHRLFPVFV